MNLFFQHYIIEMNGFSRINATYEKYMATRKHPYLQNPMINENIV